MKKILVTNDDGVRSEGIHALAEALKPLGEVTVVGAADRGERDRSRVDAAPPAPDGAPRRRRLRGRRHADRLRQHRHHAALQAERRDARPRRLGHQQGLQPRRRCDVLGDRGGGARGSVARDSRHRGLARTEPRRVRLHAPPRRPARRLPQLVLRARPDSLALFSTSTCRRDNQRACASPSRPSAITSPSSTSASIRASKPYYWIEEGEDAWEPHDRSDYQAVKDGYVSVTPLQPDLTAYDELTTLGALLKL